MPNSVDFSGRPFHFIGIGGIGMSALAYVLSKRQLPVSGSDVRPNHITQRLQALGVHVFGHQDAANLQFFESTLPITREAGAVSSVGMSTVADATTGSLKSGSVKSGSRTSTPVSLKLPQVICSTAINPANSEYQAALDLGCPIFHRSDVLAALIQDYQSIAVAGTHGKTTTSSLIGYLLLQAGLDPTIVVGGEVTAWDGNARLGHSPYLVAEADESDGSLVKLAAAVGIITNIELDHPDHYSSLEEVIDTFKVFKRNCQTLIGCIDCQTVREQLQPNITYSLNPETGADYTVETVTYRADGTTALIQEKGKVLGQLNLRLLGRHNLSNALAAVAVGRFLGLDFDAIAQALATFAGAHRRFEVRGLHHGIAFIDDYAHHPSEIQATLSAARLQVQEQRATIPNARVVALFQPHRYSRTLHFLDDFAQSFQDADLVIVTDIYSAGEPNTTQLTGESVRQAIAAYHPQVSYQPTLQAVSSFLAKTLQPGDLALFLGAGNLNQIIPEVMAFFQKIEAEKQVSGKL